VWPPVIIRNVEETAAKLKAIAGAKYTHAQLDQYTNLIARTLIGTPQANRADRKGVLPQAIYLNYSQERLASYGLQPSDLAKVLNAQNITAPGGAVQTGANTILLDPTGQFQNAESIGSVVISASSGAPVYLRDVVQISRGYQAPAQYLNYYTWTDKQGQTHRSRAITVGIYMRSGEQIKKFGDGVNERLAKVRAALPPDLMIVRTSDQPLQVEENIDLFMEALYEALILVVVIAFVGFLEWRSTLLMAMSIPITLAMTFGIAQLVGVDLQQISIDSDHCAGPSRGRSGGRQRRHQERAGGRHAPSGRRLDRADQTRPRHPVRHADQYHCLPALPASYRYNGHIPAHAAHRDDGGIALFPPDFHDLHPPARLLLPEAAEEAAANRTGTPAKGILWLSLPAFGPGYSLPLGRARPLVRVSFPGFQSRIDP
jgi:hypothetical protein